MKEFSGIHGIKKDSWLCCVKISHEETALNTFLKELGRKNERYLSKVVKKSNNLYSIITNTKHNIILDNGNEYDKYYTIIFTIDNKDNTINPLFLIPFPCNRQDVCDNIKALA